MIVQGCDRKNSCIPCHLAVMMKNPNIMALFKRLQYFDPDYIYSQHFVHHLDDSNLGYRQSTASCFSAV